jgi:metal-responsive CopG/Arc/MetJ family transcriptional regulator
MATAHKKKAPGMDKARLSISLPRNLYDEVVRISKRDSRSKGWVIRKAVEDLVKAELPLFNQS